MWIASKSTWCGALIASVIAWISGGVAGSAQTANQLTVCHAGSLEMAFTEIEKEFSAQRPDVAETPTITLSSAHCSLGLGSASGR
jgi:ABC-type molybdate transport system substrate-binding protein